MSSQIFIKGTWGSVLWDVDYERLDCECSFKLNYETPETCIVFSDL